MNGAACVIFTERHCELPAERLLRWVSPGTGRVVALDEPAAGLELLSEEVPSDVVILVRTRDESLRLCGNTAPPIRDAVTAPLSRVFRLTRGILERWMEEGVGGVVTVFLMVSGEETPSLSEAALSGFVRSVSKEHGRRGVRALLVVSTNDTLEAACDAWNVLRSPMASFVTGETLRVLPTV